MSQRTSAPSLVTSDDFPQSASRGANSSDLMMAAQNRLLRLAEGTLEELLVTLHACLKGSLGVTLYTLENEQYQWVPVGVVSHQAYVYRDAFQFGMTPDIVWRLAQSNPEHIKARKIGDARYVRPTELFYFESALASTSFRYL